MAQIRNSELVRNLTPDFHRRNDLALNHAHSIAFIQNIPGLVGLWPHADRDVSGYDNSLSGQGTVKTIQYDNNIVPYAQYDQAGSAYASVTDAAIWDITGTETYVGSGSLGLTMGGWWQVSNLGANETLMSKWAGVQKSYRMYVSTTSFINFTISVNGSADTSNLAMTSAVTADTWFYAVAWYNPSTEMRIYYGLADDADLTMENTTLAVSASAFSGSTDFSLGSMGSGAGATNFLDGRSSMSFLIRGRIPPIYIETIFDLTSPLFAAT
jgi:hypothetical protein